jgi:hypothetical protein
MGFVSISEINSKKTLSSPFGLSEADRFVGQEKNKNLYQHHRMKTLNLLAVALSIGLATFSAQAELIFRGAEFGPLQPVAGKSGKTVTISATFYGRFFNTDTKSLEYIPLATPAGSVTFDAFRSTNKAGTALVDFGPVGRPTEAAPGSGIASTTIRLPAGAKKNLLGRYRATFAGGLINGVICRKMSSSPGDVIINR